MPEKYKELLAAALKEADGRNIFTGTQVKDMLLDLWLALNEDFPESVPAVEAEAPVEVPEVAEMASA